jgi:hypothetical protein
MSEQAHHHFNLEPSGAPGECVTVTFEFDGGRQVSVYVPSIVPKAIIFTGDGQRIAKWDWAATSA